MVNRELQDYVVITYKDGADPWGQQKKVEQERKTVSIALNRYQHQQTEGPEFQEVRWFGLTKEPLNDKQKVLVNGNPLDILFVYPHRTWFAVYLK